MEDRQIAALYRQAETYRIAHNWRGAIDMLKRVLALDPEHAHAHASLALALLGGRRIHAAAIEVDLALAEHPESPFCHYAAAAVKRAHRKLDDAYKHCLVALEDDHHAIDARVLAAEIKLLQNERAVARTLLAEALAINPEHTAALTGLANVELGDGNLGEAQRHIDEALRCNAGDSDAHITAGYIALARNNLDDADSHARFVLANDATSHNALALFTALKARRNMLLGVWWRWNAFMGLRSEGRKIGLLLGSFILVQLVMILLFETGYEGAEGIVAQVWLGLCAYTWFAPAIFRWMLQRELKTVVLRDDY